MSKTKFTRGPWNVERGQGKHVGHVVVTAQGMPAHSPLAHIPDWDESEAKVDASLIAAAPDLYAALALVLKWQTDDPGDLDEHGAVMDAVRAALAKARGES